MAVLIDQPPIICKPPEIGQAPQKKIIIKRKKERKRTEGEVINFVCDLSACQDSAWNWKLGLEWWCYICLLYIYIHIFFFFLLFLCNQTGPYTICFWPTPKSEIFSASPLFEEHRFDTVSWTLITTWSGPDL